MKRENKQKQGKKAFTLIELMLYISILAVILGAIGSLFWLSLQARVKNQTISEVEQQGEQVMDVILQTVRNADTIVSPTPGNSQATLTVQKSGVSTVFALDTGKMTIVEGATAPVLLSTPKVEISDLTFTNMAEAGTNGIIRVQFTIQYTTTSTRSEYSYSKIFYGSAARR